MEPPVIILGSHRSGTSLLTRLLNRLGLFVGAYRESNDEAKFFLLRNMRIMRMAGTAWDRPIPVRAFLAEERVRSGFVARYRKDVDSLQFLEYLGASFRPRRALRRPWGWKDPRTVFTLPVWKEVFPGSKLVIIHRNGIDVAASLHRREIMNLKFDPCGAESEPRIRRRLLNLVNTAPDHGISRSTRCWSLESAYEVWEEYEEEAMLQQEAWEGDCTALRYEDLLADPLHHLAELAKFCGLDPAPGRLEEVIESMNAGRAYAFQSSEACCALYERVSSRPMMRRLGYSQVPVGETRGGIGPFQEAKV